MTPTAGPDESLDRLTDHRQVIQRKRGHRSATDDVLAAWSAWTARPDASSVLDLGCGHGTVTLLLSQVLSARFLCVEAQEISADLARRNLALNALDDRATVQRADLRTAELAPEFDLVTGTPPFMPRGSGLLPKDPQRAAGRFELRGGVEAYFEAAARALAPEGRVSILMDGAQDARCRAAVEAAGLSLVHRLVVRPQADAAPRFRGYVAAQQGTEDEPVELVVRDANRAFTPAMQQIRRRLFLERARG